MSAPAPTYGEWQPIETAPKDGSSFIGWNGEVVCEMTWTDKRDDSNQFGWCLACFEGGGTLYWHNNLASIDPTHWMPLPEPPA